MDQFVSLGQATDPSQALGWADGGVCPYVGPDALVWAAGR